MGGLDFGLQLKLDQLRLELEFAEAGIRPGGHAPAFGLRLGLANARIR
jgi:hypothetical protein